MRFQLSQVKAFDVRQECLVQKKVIIQNSSWNAYRAKKCNFAKDFLE